jgi:hypothetical protein
MDTKDSQRKKYIKEHGPRCETCGNYPVNYGQRASCNHENEYNTESYEYGKKCPQYREATSIYSIDIPYCC